ncbi:MAG TPA: 7TM diverse intracellular signaling domain-containing protein [Cytophagales bacterium]|nr:7TM diverse intracellular signaling domain-containing protein [Cytophagales bacterium]
MVYFPNAEILADTHQKYTAGNILSKVPQFGAFTPGTCSNEEIPQYWLRTKIKTDTDGKWLLEFLDPHIHKVTMYELRQGTLLQLHPDVGFGLPFTEKKHWHKNFLFDINTASRDTCTYYFKFETRLVNCFLFKLRPASSLVNYAITEYSYLSFYYGILFLMALYNLMIYLRVKERVYLYYVSYVLCCALNSFAEDGLGFQFIWPHSPEINQFVVRWVPDILLFSFVMYSVAFLHLYKTHRKVVLGILVLGACHVLANYINYEFYYGRLNFRWLFLLPFAIIYVLAVYQLYKGEKYTRFFVLGYSFILLSLVVYFLRTHGILLFHWFFNIYAFNVGFVLEVIVLSYALGERLRLEKLEKERAQQQMIAQLKENEALRQAYTSELEEKVRERTRDLEHANEEIRAFNDFLEIKNLKLEKDVVQMAKERATSKLISLEEFKKVYLSDEACKEFLSQLKWERKPYKCRKCGSEKDIPHERFYKRCGNCKYVESATANTVFHGVKIDLPEAFYILYAVYTHKDISPEELSRAVDVSEKSCAAFKKKIQDVDKAIKPKNKKDGWEYLIEVG